MIAAVTPKGWMSVHTLAGNTDRLWKDDNITNSEVLSSLEDLKTEVKKALNLSDEQITTIKERVAQSGGWIYGEYAEFGKKSLVIPLERCISGLASPA